MKSILSLALLLSLTFLNASAVQAITWNQANQIAPGAPITAAGIVELRAAIDDLRSDVDSGTGGLWSLGTGAQVYYNAGNVGIGTTTPSEKLDVTGNLKASGSLRTDARNIIFGTGDQRLYGDNDSAMYIDSNNSSTTQMIFRDKEDTMYGRVYGAGDGADFGLVDGDGQWGIKLKKDTSTSFNINNIELMRILANGNVGIGTINPNNKLEVAGNVKFRAGGLDNSLTIGEYMGSINTGPALMTDEANTLYIRPNGAGPTVINRTGANVGIGRDTPDDKLDVQGVIRVTGSSPRLRLKETDTVDNNFEIGVLGGDLRFRSQTDLFDLPNEQMRITKAGNVGIGVLNPDSKLHIDGGNMHLTMGNRLRLSPEDNGVYTSISGQNADGPLELVLTSRAGVTFIMDANATGAGSSFSFGKRTTLGMDGAWGSGGFEEQMVIENNGRVGIGTTTPTQKLDVAGTVKATAFQGNGAGLTALNASNISSGTLNLARITNDSIGADKLAPNSVAASELAVNSVGASEVANGSLVATTELSATGTKNTTTFLRGDNTWAPVPSGADNLGNHSASQDLYLNNRALVSAGGGDFDFIKHDDATNTWNFGSDQPDMNTGTSGGGSIATGNIELSGRNVIFGTGAQRISGDNGGNFYVDSNSSTVSGMIFRDKEDAIYGRVYGDGNGASFGLLDGDSQWGLLMKKDTSTSFNINNIELMRILANGNVGIGTASPSAKLHTVANGEGLRVARSATQYTEHINDNGGAFIRSMSPTNNAKGLTFDSTNPANAAPTSGDNYIRFNVRGTERLRVAANGNVGIGTSSPSQKLDVAGTIKGTAFQGNGAGLTALNANNISAGTLSLDRIANDSIPAGKLAADSVAASELAVNSVGASEVANGSLVATTELSATGTKNTTTFLRGDNTWAPVPSGADNLGNHSASQDLYLNNRALVSAGGGDFDFIKHDDATNTWNFGSDQSDMNTGTSGGGSIATGNIKLSGQNVIFGTGDQRLYGDNGGIMYLDSNNSTTTSLRLRDLEDTTYGRLHGGGNGTDFGLLDGDSQWGIMMKKDNYTSFNINNIEQMRIIANGNVGIGTTAPAEKLEVSGKMIASGTIESGRGGGAVALTTNDGGGNASVTFNHTGRKPDQTGNAGRITVNVDSTTGASMSFQLADNLPVGVVNSTQEILILKANGNVGIGTGAPSTGLKLDVEGKVGATEYCDQNGANCVAAAVLGGGSGVIIGQTINPASTTCNYGGNYTLLPAGIGVKDGKYAISYFHEGVGCLATTCSRVYDGTWGACDCYTTDNCGP